MAKSDVKRAFKEDGSIKTHIGGQALIEGVMMRGKSCWAVAVREPSGVVYTEEHDLRKSRGKGWLSWPLIRGCVALIDSLTIGFKALEIAANHAIADEYEDSDKEEAREGIFSDKTIHPTSMERSSSDVESDSFGKGAMALSMILGIALGLALFIFLPALVSNVLVGDYDTNTLAWNIIDGLARVAIFVFYVWLIGRMKDIKRMFAYHGAEHKTIHCYEHGLALTPENARSFPRLHIRCGTAFLIMVMIIAILVYTIIPLDKVIVCFGIADSAAKFFLFFSQE